MDSAQYVVVELRVDASDAVQNSAQYSAALDKASQAADALTSSAQKTQLAITSQSNAMTQAKAANDNLASGYQAANDNFNSFGSSLANHAIDFLNNLNHLKLMAVGAYAISPAFRSFANTGVQDTLQLVGVNAGLVSSAFAELLSLASPVLSFFSRIAIPIAIAVAAWQALNYLINQGSALLTQYGNSERSLFGSNVQSNLDTLTKGQTDSISLEQVQYATELGTRLTDAKQAISDFWNVTIDTTQASLQLQNVWVVIVESIAHALDLLQQIPSSLASGAQAVGNSSIWNSLNFGWHLPGALTPSQVIQAPATQDNSQALALAQSKLAAMMGVKNSGTSGASVGGSFAAQFTQLISALSGTGNPSASSTSTNAYQRSLQTIQDQISMLALEADGASKTSEAYEELKTAHTLNLAAMKAGIPVTSDMQTQWKSLGDQIAAYTIQLNQAKVLQTETFASQTMFMSPGDLAAANAAKQIDPTNWMAHLQDAGPQLAAFNSELTQTRDLSSSFADSFGQAMLQGKTATQALQTALTSLESQLINMISKQLVNQAFGGLLGTSGGTNILSLLGIGGGASSTLAKSNAAATGASASDVAFAFSSGGMVGAGGRRVWVHRAYFENAPHFDSGGMITDGGVPIVAHPGERVLNAQETAAYNSSGGVQVNVNVDNQAGADVGVSQQKNSSGGVDLTVMVRKAVDQNLTRGLHDKALGSRFGVKPIGQTR